MKVADICSHRGITLPLGASVADAVALMYAERVGTVIVTRSAAGRSTVVGILTDRDIVTAQLEQVADFSQLNIAEAMTLSPLVVQGGEDVTEVLQKLRTRRVRRAPVVDELGAPIGLISTDDLLLHLAQQISGLATVVCHQAGSDD